MTRFGLGPVHSPAGPGPIIWVQVHPYLDLDLDIWGPDRCRMGLQTVYCCLISPFYSQILYYLSNIIFIVISSCNSKEVPAHESCTSAWLVSPAAGCEKKMEVSTTGPQTTKLSTLEHLQYSKAIRLEKLQSDW